MISTSLSLVGRGSDQRVERRPDRPALTSRFSTGARRTTYGIGIAILTAVVTCLACWSRPALAQSPHTPLIVLIHGRNQEYQIGGMLQEQWEQALEDGLASIGAGDVVPRDAQRFVWYGWVYEHEAHSGPECGPTSSPTGLAYARPGSSLLTGWLGSYLTSGDRNDAVFAVRNVAQSVLSSPKLFALRFPDVKQYKQDPAAQCQTERALIDTLRAARDSARPVILIAHSLGSLVAFRVLSEMAGEGHSVKYLITIGSQLGATGMPHWLLDGAWPAKAPHVGRWINAVARDDPLAFPVLAEASLKLVADSIRDLYVTTKEDDPHWYGGYLKNSAVATAVLEAWCNIEDGYGGSGTSATAPQCAAHPSADSCHCLRDPFPPARFFVVAPYVLAAERQRATPSIGVLGRTALFPIPVRLEMPTSGYTTRHPRLHSAQAIFPINIDLFSGTIAGQQKSDADAVGVSLIGYVGTGFQWSVTHAEDSVPRSRTLIWGRGIGIRDHIGRVTALALFDHVSPIRPSERAGFPSRPVFLVGFALDPTIQGLRK